MMEMSEGQEVLSIRREIFDGITSSPIITHNVSVFENLNFKIQVDGLLFPANKVKYSFNTDNLTSP